MLLLSAINLQSAVCASWRCGMWDLAKKLKFPSIQMEKNGIFLSFH